MSQATDSGMINRLEGDNSAWLALQTEDVLERVIASADGMRKRLPGPFGFLA